MQNTHFKGDLLAQTSPNEADFATTKGKAQSRREFIADSAKLGAALALFGAQRFFQARQMPQIWAQIQCLLSRLTTAF